MQNKAVKRSSSETSYDFLNHLGVLMFSSQQFSAYLCIHRVVVLCIFVPDTKDMIPLVIID